MAHVEVTVIYETIHGSRAYGLATETSDTDLRGVFVPPPLAFTGFVAQPDQIEPAAERVLYEIRKFFHHYRGFFGRHARRLARGTAAHSEGPALRVSQRAHRHPPAAHG